MTDPISFPSATPRFALPLLFAGQSQKEFYVNEAHALTDVLLHAACEGESVNPPAAPGEGESWIVAAGATGEWAAQDGKLAARQSGNWLFAVPSNGMRVFDRSSGQMLLYRDGWQRPTAPTVPSTGSVVDSEVRAVLADLLAALAQAGVFAGD